MRRGLGAKQGWDGEEQEGERETGSHRLGVSIDRERQEIGNRESRAGLSAESNATGLMGYLGLLKFRGIRRDEQK